MDTSPVGIKNIDKCLIVYVKKVKHLVMFNKINGYIILFRVKKNSLNHKAFITNKIINNNFVMMSCNILSKINKRLSYKDVLTLAPWHLGTLAPWHLGSLAPWLVCLLLCL